MTHPNIPANVLDELYQLRDSISRSLKYTDAPEVRNASTRAINAIKSAETRIEELEAENERLRVQTKRLFAANKRLWCATKKAISKLRWSARQMDAGSLECIRTEVAADVLATALRVESEATDEGRSLGGM